MRWFRRGGKEPPEARERSDDVRFFFYFAEEQAARSAGSVLEGKGYGVKVTPPDEAITQWSVHATGIPDTEDLEEADELMGPWAARLGGEYDGHEIAVG